MIALQMFLLILTVSSGIAVAALRNPLPQALMLGFHGLVLALFLLTLRAPDVALAQIAIGSAALPLMILAAIANARRREARDE